MPVRDSSICWSTRPPITTVCPVRARSCVVASRVLMMGAPNWVSAVALLTSWLRRRLTYPSSLMVGRMVRAVPTSRYWTTSFRVPWSVARTWDTWTKGRCAPTRMRASWLFWAWIRGRERIRTLPVAERAERVASTFTFPVRRTLSVKLSPGSGPGRKAVVPLPPSSFTSVAKMSTPTLRSPVLRTSAMTTSMTTWRGRRSRALMACSMTPQSAAVALTRRELVISSGTIWTSPWRSPWVNWTVTGAWVPVAPPRNCWADCCSMAWSCWDRVCPTRLAVATPRGADPPKRACSVADRTRALACWSRWI